MSDNESNMEEFLRQLLGEQAARAAMESMRARGIDPESLNSQFPDPYMMKQALTQFAIMMNGPASGPIDWKSALQVA
ncbi:MAG: hydrolase, partial [Trueperella pyogenes]|nr:hydrolase [Trueperella pyogenes]